MKIYVIIGQTATGKTAKALEIAKKVNGELINFDSRQVYKKLDIVTGKDIDTSQFHEVEKGKNFDIGYFEIHQPTCLAGRQATDHRPPTKLWLYDVADPKTVFSSYDFTKCAVLSIKQIIKEGRAPILVGGTYLYLYHLLYDIPTGNEPNWRLRKELEGLDISKLQRRLEKKSPDIFAKLNNSDLHNPHRLIRKIELAESGQKTYANLPRERITLGEKLNEINLELEITGYFCEDKNELRNVITERVEKRIKSGAVDELKKLLAIGYKLSDPGLITIGYPQIKRFIDGEITEEQLKAEWITKELKYAKRQYTFMKRDKNIKWTVI